MALRTRDRIQETSIIEGTGTVTLTGAVDGNKPFSEIGNANTLLYCIEAVNGQGVPTGDFEVGRGTYTLSGTTLSRNEVYRNSLGTQALISFTAGDKKVFVTDLADFLLRGQVPTVSPGVGDLLLGDGTRGIHFDASVGALKAIGTVDIGTTTDADQFRDLHLNRALNVGDVTASAAEGDAVFGDGSREMRFDASLGRQFINHTPSVDDSVADTLLYLANNNRCRIVMRAAHAGNTQNEIRFMSSRGSLASKTILGDGDLIFNLIGLAYDGSSFRGGGAISARIDGTVSTNVTPTELQFSVNPGASNAIAWTMKPDFSFVGGVEATTVTIQGVNATTANTKGASLTVRGGDGFATNADGGDALVKGGAPAGSGTEGTVTLGTAAASKIGVHGATPVVQSDAYTLNATVVINRTLLQSSAATVLNNNNVIAALVTDLQAAGWLG